MLELLMAMVMLNVGILAVVAAFSSGNAALYRANRISTSGALANKQMEAYRGLKYDNIVFVTSEWTSAIADSTYTGDTVYQLWEWHKVWRQIPLNKPHPTDPDITWYGESVGKWEDDTLVVDSVGFKDSTWLDGVGHPHSEELRVTERIRRVDPETLQIDFTLDDPVAYSRPWTSQHTFKLAPDGTMTETITTMSDELLYR